MKGHFLDLRALNNDLTVDRVSGTLAVRGGNPSRGLLRPVEDPE